MDTETTSRGRVLFISPQPFFEWRGSPIRVSFDVRALAELGYEVDLLTLPMGRALEIPGVRVLRVPYLPGLRDVKIGPSWAKALYDVALLFRAVRLARRQRYACIHGVEEAGALAWFAARLTRTPCVFEKHSDPFSYRKGLLVNMVVGSYSAVERFTARHTDAVIVTGTGLADQVRKQGRKEGIHHIFDIPSSVSVPTAEAIAAARARLTAGGAEVVATYVGSFAVYQGVDLLFGAIAEVVKRHPRAGIAVIGGSPEQIAERRVALARVGAAGAVQFLGLVPPDELPAVLAASDILLSPRLTGVNTPLKLLDYLKAGRAIVATDTPANRLILDDETAVMVAPEAAAFAAGIGRLVEDSALRDRLGSAGRRLTDARYNFANFKQLLDACYEEVRARRPGRERAGMPA